MDEMTSLGKFISLRRKFLRLTQEELAEKIGVSKSAVAKWETERGIPDRDNLGRLAEVMNVSVDDLHRLIRNAANEEVDINVNITPDVIAALQKWIRRLSSGHRPARRNGGKHHEQKLN